MYLHARLPVAIVVVAAVLSGCRLATFATPCDTDEQCPAGFWCERRERFCVANRDASGPGDGAVVLDGAIADRPNSDLVRTDADRDAGVVSDGAADIQSLDLHQVDQGAAADRTTLSDHGALADANGGADAMVGTDGAQLLDNAPRPDNGPRPDAAGADACAASFGRPCIRSGFCGATFDCLGSCTGGSLPAVCTQCQYRVCQTDLTTWSDCQGGCDFNSHCVVNTCLCNNFTGGCTASECDGDTLLNCILDTSGCGEWTAQTWCPYGCSGSPAGCLGFCNPGCVDGMDACHNGSELAYCGCYGNACIDCTGYNECTQCDCM